MPVNERAKLGIFMAFQNPIAVKGISVENFIRNAKSTITGETQRIMPFRKKLRAQMEELRMDKSYAIRGLMSMRFELFPTELLLITMGKMRFSSLRITAKFCKA